MSDKATPRPWSIAPCSDEYPVRDIVSEYETLPGGRESANWIAQCDIQDDDESDPETNDANARLIVSAVNAYEAHQRAALALREAVLAKERELDGFRKALGRDPLVKCEWYDSARDALAELDKLEGRP